jgi:hypothetical protein
MVTVRCKMDRSSGVSIGVGLGKRHHLSAERQGAAGRLGQSAHVSKFLNQASPFNGCLTVQTLDFPYRDGSRTWGIILLKLPIEAKLLNA